MTSQRLMRPRTLILITLALGWWVTILEAQPPPWGCGKRGSWTCTTYGWGAGTTFRSMQGTRFECGGGIPLVIPGICGDTSHSQPESWVDIAGGLSQSCDDHSSSFFGPLSGQWDGCNPYALQVSSGYQTVESVNNASAWWPFPGGVQDVWSDGFCENPLLGPSPPPYVWFTQPANFTVSGVFATVYDLDTCIDKQLIGSVYWADFTVVATVVTDTPTYKVTQATGQAPVACAVQENECTNDVLCSDLAVNTTQVCEWRWDNPMTRCDPGC